ncbi:stage II sporulation protein M [Bacteroidales bacterium OttesenSCG-928-M06]|nr:stage II sporulation protein M [Bacteroidales bacterium OttesenSCG-928-M06]
MKEAVFIYLNKEKWKDYEVCLKNIRKQSPDVLADIYIDVTNDLSYAQTHYPDSKIAIYLNGLSSRLHQFINEKKKWKFSRLIEFWKTDVPLVMCQSRKELLYSFLIFMLSVCIGAFSAANDDSYVRLVLGDSYVEMTLRNIENNDPMAVYKQNSQEDMFWMITWNNIFVSFKAFVAGLFTSLGTVVILFVNGTMIGSFQYFFIEQGLLLESFLAIWLHGTLEISAIIIAGCAGITMGNGWLFPGTYTRFESFKQSAQKGIKIIVGTIPVFVIAGFIESYLTRLTDVPNIFRLLLIILSLAFILFYYVIYPKKLVKEIN